ncbi:MAG: hypothetical protein E7311_01700 [Clostridiales bacterium]|nr:hypothetical protein [Clostridiales bacterium]
MNFKKKLKSRLNIGVIYIIIGLLLISSTFIINTENYFISSFGFTLVVLGIVRIRNYYLITRNEENIRKQEIAETDERNISIINKSKSTTLSIYILLLCITVIILSFFNLHDIASYLAYSVLLFVVIYWICYFIYQKKL